MTADGVYKLLQVYAEKIGLTGIESLGVHALRATAATNALDHQADIAKVQEWLGHANISTTRLSDRSMHRAEIRRRLKWSINPEAGRRNPQSLCEQY